MKIYTRQLRNDTWSCSATIEGYDYAFIGQTYIIAQEKMTHLLKKKGIYEKAVFLEPVKYIHLPKEPKPPVTYAKNRIDNL